MGQEQILQRIAYAYYELCKRTGFADNPARDWRFAEKALAHLSRPIDYSSHLWRADEDEYGEYRCYLS